MISDVERLFKCLLVIYMSSLEKCQYYYISLLYNIMCQHLGDMHNSSNIFQMTSVTKSCKEINPFKVQAILMDFNVREYEKFIGSFHSTGHLVFKKLPLVKW